MRVSPVERATLMCTRLRLGRDKTNRLSTRDNGKDGPGTKAMAGEYNAQSRDVQGRDAIVSCVMERSNIDRDKVKIEFSMIQVWLWRRRLENKGVDKKECKPELGMSHMWFSVSRV